MLQCAAIASASSRLSIKGNILKSKSKPYLACEISSLRTFEKGFYMCMLQYATVCSNCCCMMLNLRKSYLNEYRIESCWGMPSFSHQESLKEELSEKKNRFSTISTQYRKDENDNIPTICLVFMNSEPIPSSRINFKTQYIVHTSLGCKKMFVLLKQKAFLRMVKKCFLGYTEVTIKIIEKTKIPNSRCRWELRYFCHNWWKWLPVFW